MVRFTVNRAEFAIALVNSLKIGTDFNIVNDYFCPKEYDPKDDQDNPYCASKGNMLVFIECLAENLDRNFLDLDDMGDPEFINIEYNGEVYTEDTFAEKKWGWNIEDYENLDTSHWDSQSVTNMLLGVGTVELIRGYVEVPFEPESPTDPFGLIITLPTSDGTGKQFVYDVNPVAE